MLEIYILYFPVWAPALKWVPGLCKLLISYTWHPVHSVAHLISWPFKRFFSQVKGNSQTREMTSLYKLRHQQSATRVYLSHKWYLSTYPAPLFLFCCHSSAASCSNWLSTSLKGNNFTIILYFWFRYDLDKSTTHPKFDQTQGSNPWLPDHDSTFHVPGTP